MERKLTMVYFVSLIVYGKEMESATALYQLNISL